MRKNAVGINVPRGTFPMMAKVSICRRCQVTREKLFIRESGAGKKKPFHMEQRGGRFSCHGVPRGTATTKTRICYLKLTRRQNILYKRTRAFSPNTTRRKKLFDLIQKNISGEAPRQQKDRGLRREKKARPEKSVPRGTSAAIIILRPACSTWNSDSENARHHFKPGREGKLYYIKEFGRE